MTVEAAIKKSNERFLSLVWPVVRLWMGGGDIVPVEAVTNPRFAEDMLDKYGSIDLWHVLHERGKMRGIASRVQKLKYKIFHTFTLRDNGPKSEFERLRTSIEGHFLHPELFCQAYLVPGDAPDALAYVAMVKVRDLIKFFEDGNGQKNINTQDKKPFRVAKILELEKAGIKVRQANFK